MNSFSVTGTLQDLLPAQRITLRFYYLAAVFLQRTFSDQLKRHLAEC